MRIIMMLVIMIFVTGIKAQSLLSGSYLDYNNRQVFIRNPPASDSSSPGKWSFSKQIGMSASYQFFNGGNSSVFSLPISLQLNRKLTDHLYAFTGVSVAPAYTNINYAFGSADLTKINSNNAFTKKDNLGMYARAELGLMYINTEKTFSISGSIGVERSSYPRFYYNPINTATGSKPFMSSNQ